MADFVACCLPHTSTIWSWSSNQAVSSLQVSRLLWRQSSPTSSRWVAPVPGSPRQTSLADLAVAGSTLAALGVTHGQYVRLTARSMNLLKEHQLVHSETGSFWGFVRDSKRITGVLDFESVSFGPEQMLALQTRRLPAGASVRHQGGPSRR